MTSTDRHAVLATVRTDQGTDIDAVVFEGTWNEAQTAWTILDATRDDDHVNARIEAQCAVCLRHYSVRSCDDPRTIRARTDAFRMPRHNGHQWLLTITGQAIDRGMRAAARKQLGELARDAVNDADLDTLGAVIRQVAGAAKVLGLAVTSYDVQQAVKSRVTLARWGQTSVAYFTPKGRGRTIRDMEAVTGRHLHQTTLALQADFQRVTIDPTTGRTQ